MQVEITTELQGKERTLTVFGSYIPGFTSFKRTDPPENEYFDIEKILDEEGNEVRASHFISTNISQLICEEIRSERE